MTIRDDKCLTDAKVYTDAGGERRLAIRYADGTEEDMPMLTFIEQRDDAKADALRLHQEKMDLLDQKLSAPRTAVAHGIEQATMVPVLVPKNLHPTTKMLIAEFANALAVKLHAAEEKYGYDDGWSGSAWEEECRARLYEHLEKGDPRDVANYCAFMWHHDWSTKRSTLASADADRMPEEVIRQQHALRHPATQVFFRAGLIACREYLARFVEAQDPIIAQSIRANWWPSLGQDFGPPRKLHWDELAEGEPPNLKVKDWTPTQEALPIALQFLETLHLHVAAIPPTGGAR